MTIQIIIALLTILATTAFFCGTWATLGPRIKGYYDTQELRVKQTLQQLFISTYTARQVIVMTLIAALVTGLVVWAVTGSVIVSLIGFLVTWFIPNLIFQVLRTQRMQKIVDNLPAALDQMASSAKAGLNLAQLIEHVEKNSNPPISEEFGLIMQEYRLGHDLETAIESARRRIDNKLFSLFASAVLVNREKGGNLPEALEAMSNSFKEIARLEQKVVTASAEGRKGVRVISLMPIFIFIFISLAQPELIDTLVSSFIGWVFIALAVLLYVLALFWLRKILAVDV